MVNPAPEGNGLPHVLGQGGNISDGRGKGFEFQVSSLEFLVFSLLNHAKPVLGSLQTAYNKILICAFSLRVLTHSENFFSISFWERIRRISGATSSKGRAPPLRRSTT